MPIATQPDPIILRIGDAHVGIRTTEPWMHEVLRSLLAAHLAPDATAPTSYLVRVADAPKNRRATGFHLLHKGTAIVLRTRDLERLVQGLITHLDTHRQADDGTLRAQGVALVGARGALAAPAALRRHLAQVERRLNVRGVRIADQPWVQIDWKAREVVVPEPELDLDWTAMSRLADKAREGLVDPVVPAARYPLVGWAFATAESGSSPSRAQAVAMAARLTVAGGPAGLQDLLDALSHLMAGVPPFRLRWDAPKLLTAPLLDMMEGGS
jgi:hypothetical protein